MCLLEEMDAILYWINVTVISSDTGLKPLSLPFQFHKCGNYGNLLSQLFGKNFVKTTFSLLKLLKSWFDEIFFLNSKSFIFPHCPKLNSQLLVTFFLRNRNTFCEINFFILNTYIGWNKFNLTWKIFRKID